MGLIHLNAIFADVSTTPMQSNPQGDLLKTVVMFACFGIAFYFLLIRPQQKKAKQQAAMLQSAKPGDKVLTSAGILGVIVSVKDKSVTIRSADTKMEITKSSVTEITERAGESSES